MRVREGPHEATSFVGDAEITLHFQTVQCFKDQAHREIDQHSPPTEAQVAPDENFRISARLTRRGRFFDWPNWLGFHRGPPLHMPAIADCIFRIPAFEK